VSQQQLIDRGFFREADDGTTVFFPWGLSHRGYQLSDDTARKKASRAASFLVSSVIGIGVWGGYALEPILESEAAGFTEIVRLLAAPGAVLLLVVVSYALWVSRFVERFPESDLRVSREQRLREAAGLVEPWKVAWIGVVLCGLSALLIWLEPRMWWLGGLGVALGIGLLLWSSLLRRAAADLRG
jgi:hypothetical protein